MPTRDEVFATVRETLVDALGVDDDGVTPTATLMGDLGAESIDFLDIVFRLEKNFNIKIPRGELFPENLVAADSGFIVNGKVTPEGIKELRTKMPHANIDVLAADPRVEKVQDLFTVHMVVEFSDEETRRNLKELSVVRCRLSVVGCRRNASDNWGKARG